MTPVLDLDALSEPCLRALAEDGGITLDHASQLAFLTAATSLDVQAAPGSGKTTLTALKLCAMARGWRSSTTGICVLSHTNVAKNQIIERLQDDRFGRALLRPPHFIGTIQAFVDAFLGLPYARSRGLDVRVLANDAYAAESLRRLDIWRRFGTLKGFLSRKWSGPDAVATATFVCDGSEELSIEPERGDLGAGPTSKSHRQYVALKQSMAADGYFRFLDMYGFAWQLLHGHPGIASAVAARFPWVIIDEMQDTDAAQQALLDRVLPSDRSVVQRIGDENQRIFSEESDGSFPNPAALELPVSRRFGSRIAEIVSSLTIRRPQEVVGSPERDDQHLMLLLFDEESATQVIPRFAQEAESALPPAERETYPLKAVAGRVRTSQATTFPRTILSYVPDYETEATVAKLASTSTSLIDSVRAAQRMTMVTTGRWQEAVSMLWGSLAAVAALCHVEATTGRMTGNRLRRMVRLDSTAAELETRQLLRHLLEEADTETEPGWSVTLERLAAWLVLSGSGITEAAAVHCAYAVPVPREIPAPPPSVQLVEASTIHGVKGETHSATLLLECLTQSGRDHDLPQVLELITGRVAPGDLTESAQEACQLAFVAASRPRSMLTLAVHADHADPYLDHLRAEGWSIVDVREEGTVA